MDVTTFLWSVGAGIVASSIYTLIPWIARGLVRVRARLLRSTNTAERLEEEWLAALWELGSRRQQLMFVLSLCKDFRQLQTITELLAAESDDIELLVEALLQEPDSRLWQQLEDHLKDRLELEIRESVEAAVREEDSQQQLLAAWLCSDLSRADIDTDITPLIRRVLSILNGIGLIVWTWQPESGTLKPTSSYGYSNRVLSQLPTVRRDADNATAAAFRSGQVCAVAGENGTTSALAVPVMTPTGCVGVLAVELQNGAEQSAAVRAVALLFASQLGRLLEP